MSRTWIATGAALLLALGMRAAQANPPAEAFGSLPLGSEPVLSPDGKHFALIQSLRGRPAIQGA